MLGELVRLFGCLAVGEVLARAGLPFPRFGDRAGRPLSELLAMGRLPAALGTIADAVLGVFGMLFVPAGVGVLAYLGLFETEFEPIAAALLGGTIVTFIVTVLVANWTLWLAARRRKPVEERADAAA